MTHWICTVPVKLPENYEIGMRAHCWGVEEKYFSKIDQVHDGDHLIFLVNGGFRSIHRIEGDAFEEHTALWPEKDGSVFPYRIKISDAIAVGDVRLDDIEKEISFTKQLDRAYGAFQGPNGVFNGRLTDTDFESLRVKMNRPVPAPVQIDPEASRRASERQSAIVRIHEESLEDRIIALLPTIGLHVEPSNRKVRADTDSIDALATDAQGRWVVVLIHRGSMPQEMLLRVLRLMSWTRANRPEKKDVYALVVTGETDPGLQALVRELPNVKIQYYQFRLELTDSPSKHRTATA